MNTWLSRKDAAKKISVSVDTVERRAVPWQDQRVGQRPFVHRTVRIAVMPWKEPRRVWVVLRLPLRMRLDQGLQALVIGNIRIDGMLPLATPNVNGFTIGRRGPELIAPPHQHFGGAQARVGLK